MNEFPDEALRFMQAQKKANELRNLLRLLPLQKAETIFLDVLGTMEALRDNKDNR